MNMYVALWICGSMDMAWMHVECVVFHGRRHKEMMIK